MGATRCNTAVLTAATAGSSQSRPCAAATEGFQSPRQSHISAPDTMVSVQPTCECSRVHQHLVSRASAYLTVCECTVLNLNPKSDGSGHTVRFGLTHEYFNQSGVDEDDDDVELHVFRCRLTYQLGTYCDANA